MFEGIRRLSDDKQKDITGNLLLFSLYSLETAYLYSACSATLIIAGIIGMLTYLYVRENNGAYLRLMIIIAVGVIALVTINRLFVLNCSWRGCLRISFISLPIAYLLCDVRINRYAALSFFYVVFLYTVIMIALADPAELYRIFAASSRNYISVLLIACLFPYYLACERDRAEVSIFPALLSLPVSIYVQSRGGMLASGILVAFSFIWELYLGIGKGAFKSKKKLLRFIMAATLLSGIILFTFSHSSDSAGPVDLTEPADSADSVDSVDYLSRFYQPEEYPITRSDMWKEYITVTGSSIKHVLLGPPLTACPLILKEAYNIHNSYFMTHSYMGLAGFLAVLAGGIGYLVLCIKKNRFHLLFLSISFLFRAMTDYLFPMLFCDGIILLMIMTVGMEMMRAGDKCAERKNLNHRDSRV